MILPYPQGRSPIGQRPADRRRPSPLLGVVWALLVLNTLGSGGDATILPIPGPIAQMITMGALGIAFAIALLLNPRTQIRPNAFLLLLTILLIVSTVSSAYMESGPGALARCARLAIFVATLWLITPWWGASLVMLRHHLRALCAIVASVVLGLILAPGLAMPEEYEGRLVGVLWYLPPPQVAHFAAAAAGLALVLWLGKQIGGRNVLFIAVPAIIVLLLTHTRTATIGLVGGLALAGVTLFFSSARARRTLTAATAGAAFVALAFSAALLSWFRRGQGEDALESLTGRQKVWDALLAEPRTTRELLVGVGLGDKTFNGLPIDSGWLSVYHEQGVLGVALVAAFLVVLVLAAMMCRPSPQRACAVFLIAYCGVASYTEVGLGDASAYLLHLTLAAALLAPTTTSKGADLTAWEVAEKSQSGSIPSRSDPL